MDEKDQDVQQDHGTNQHAESLPTERTTPGAGTAQGTPGIIAGRFLHHPMTLDGDPTLHSPRSIPVLSTFGQGGASAGRPSGVFAAKPAMSGGNGRTGGMPNREPPRAERDGAPIWHVAETDEVSDKTATDLARLETLTGIRAPAHDTASDVSRQVPAAESSTDEAAHLPHEEQYYLHDAPGQLEPDQQTEAAHAEDYLDEPYDDGAFLRDRGPQAAGQSLHTGGDAFADSWPAAPAVIPPNRTASPPAQRGAGALRPPARMPYAAHALPSHVPWEAAHSWGTTTITFSANTAAGLSYLFWWLSGIFFFFGEHRNRYVRFHAMQSIILTALFTAIGGVTSLLLWLLQTQVQNGVLVALGVAFTVLIAAGIFFLWLFAMVAAWTGHYVHLGAIGRYADRWAAPPLEPEPGA